MTNTQSFEMYILEGEQAGARAQIQPDTSIIVGGDPDGDIVLRDTQLKGQSFRLDVSADMAQVEVLSGSIEIQGRQVAEGSRAELHPCIPLKIGQTTLAYGAAGDGQFQERQQSGDVPVQEQMQSGASWQQGVSPERKYGSMLLWLALAGTLLIGLGIYKGINDSVAQSRIEMTETSVAWMLKNAGFSGLTVEKGEEGGFAIRGYLETTVQHERLEQILEDLNVFAQVHVLTGEHLAATVQDIYRVNGIKAEVLPEGSGIVQVKTAEADLEKLNKVALIAREDIAGLRDIVVHNNEPEKPAEPTLVKDDPGKRVAAVVPGDPAYVVTVDGARYFVGSMMPSGHKIFAILDQRIVLDKNGTMIALDF